MIDSVAWYSTNAETVVAQYEMVSPDVVHGWFHDLLPKHSASVLDIGSGSGRDAAWLASKGYDVVAVEPSTPMRTAAASLHAKASIRWIDDRLPGLSTVSRSGLTFDLILLNAVWIHLPETDRPRAFRKVINLLKPGGLLVITLRHGPADQERGIYTIPPEEIEALARDHGAFVERQTKAEDHLGRHDIHWSHLVIRLPDDGTGALPLLRNVILNDNKSSTYKLALLRALCRIADAAAGCARDAGDDFVAVPLGLVALTWIRLFKPLLSCSLPQSPQNIDLHGLGFVRDKVAFRKLVDANVSDLDLRVGMRFSEEMAVILHQALKDVANTIRTMPAHYMTYPSGGQVFPVNKIGRVSRPSSLHLNQNYLLSFGEMFIPKHLWRTLQRFDVWIEPAIVAEWQKLIKSYALKQGIPVDNTAMVDAMIWSKRGRGEIELVRKRALEISASKRLFCVWSGKFLNDKNLDIDHCLPWTVWSCGDLWNLMPAHRAVNRKKSAKLPTDQLLQSAQERVIDWWKVAYMDYKPTVSEQFLLEAKSSLPCIPSNDDALNGIFEAVCYQRIRLKNDQQVPEWSGEQSS